MIDITLSKAKYQDKNHKTEHRPHDPKPEGTKTFVVASGGAYVSREVSNGPIRVKKYSKRSNKIRCRRKTYLGCVKTA